MWITHKEYTTPINLNNIISVEIRHKWDFVDIFFMTASEEFDVWTFGIEEGEKVYLQILEIIKPVELGEQDE